MSESNSVRLGELAEVKGGKRLPKGELLTSIPSAHPYVRITDMQGKWLNINDNSVYVNPNIQHAIRNYTVDNGDVILSIVGHTIGLVARIGETLHKANLTENCVKILPKNAKLLDKDYLYYFLISNIGQSEIDSKIVGSSQPKLPLYNIKDIELFLPPLPEQKAIASVLSSLDDKIDLLHRQNKTLEAMAETLLIQHILPKEDTQDEELHQLGDYLDTVSVTHKLSKSQVIFLNTSDIYKGKVLTTELSDVKTLPGQAKKSILKGDILFSEIRPANGRYALVDFEADNYVVSTKLMVLRAKQSKLLGLLYFYITNRHTTDWLQILAESRSGTFPQITFDQVADLEFRLPKGQMLENLILLLDDILLKQSANNKQIQTLEQLRDTLLPKLMSGEVRVQYQTEDVA